MAYIASCTYLSDSTRCCRQSWLCSSDLGSFESEWVSTCHQVSKNRCSQTSLNQHWHCTCQTDLDQAAKMNIICKYIHMFNLLNFIIICTHNLLKLGVMVYIPEWRGYWRSVHISKSRYHLDLLSEGSCRKKSVMSINLKCLNTLKFELWPCWLSRATITAPSCSGHN